MQNLTVANVNLIVDFLRHSKIRTQKEKSGWKSERDRGKPLKTLGKYIMLTCNESDAL